MLRFCPALGSRYKVERYLFFIKERKQEIKFQRRSKITSNWCWPVSFAKTQIYCYNTNGRCKS